MAEPAEIQVLSTQAPEPISSWWRNSEEDGGHKATTVFTGTPQRQKRLARRRAYDLIIMAGPAIDEQIKLGKASAGEWVAARLRQPRPGASDRRHPTLAPGDRLAGLICSSIAGPP